MREAQRFWIRLKDRLYPQQNQLTPIVLMCGTLRRLVKCRAACCSRSYRACDCSRKRSAIIGGKKEGEANKIPRQSARLQPVSACSLRTTRTPIVTSSSNEIARDSMPVWRLNFRGMVSPNHELLSIQFGRCTEIAEMPRPLAFSCMSIKSSTSIVVWNEKSLDTGNPAQLVLAEKCQLFFEEWSFSFRNHRKHVQYLPWGYSNTTFGNTLDSVVMQVFLWKMCF